MLNLPKWVQRIFDESVCPFCKAKTNKNGVFAEGIREEINSESNNPYLSFFFFYLCGKCHQSSTFSGLPVDFEEFVEDMVEVLNSPTPTTANHAMIAEVSPPDDSGISDQEFLDFKQMLKATKYHEDFLAKIGINKKDIKKEDNGPC